MTANTLSDFSSIAVGGVMSQVQEESEKFIGCFSKSCDTAQRNYLSFKGELLVEFADSESLNIYSELKSF